MWIIYKNLQDYFSYWIDIFFLSTFETKQKKIYKIYKTYLLLKCQRLFSFFIRKQKIIAITWTRTRQTENLKKNCDKYLKRKIENDIRKTLIEI